MKENSGGVLSQKHILIHIISSQTFSVWMKGNVMKLKRRVCVYGESIEST